MSTTQTSSILAEQEKLFDILSKPELSGQNITDVETILSNEGLFTRQADENWDWRSQSGLTDYISRYPDTLAHTHVNHLKDLVEDPEKLEKIVSAAQKSDLFQEIVYVDVTNSYGVTSEDRWAAIAGERNAVYMTALGLYSGDLEDNQSLDLTNAMERFRDSYLERHPEQETSLPRPSVISPREHLEKAHDGQSNDAEYNTSFGGGTPNEELPILDVEVVGPKPFN